MRIGTAAICLAVLTAATGLRAAGEAQPPTRTMHEIFDAIAYLLPASIQAMRDRDYADQALLQRKLATLEASAESLERHARGGEQEFQLLARAFEDRIADVEAAFEGDYPSFAYFSLMGLIDHCAACHARLPDKSDFAIGQRLLARIDTDALDRLDLADILVATRQFEAALGRLENELADRSIDPIDHDLAGTFIGYLDVAITVVQDLERARQTLETYLERPDVPFFLRRRIGGWLEDMSTLRSELTGPPDFHTAEALVAAAGEQIIVPGDRSAAVKDLVAASMLRRLVAEGLDAGATARAYYMLGLVALRTAELRPAVPEMELLLVSAIRSQPSSPVAEEAYALLEEYGFIEDQRLSAAPGAKPLIDLAELEALVTQ